ncbi:MAG: aquaporin [Candidatus Diapherotrites archaeon]|uniref:Aquaporin n=1 Tax=Candidatus Iainarchaeum sp. TaxID=3101447 RepID=A0A8T3YJL9_9ARCH|nr:aquaporin [Candidatus Diapherotrites archaeon]
MRLGKDVLSEFFGTFVLVFAITASIVGSLSLTGGDFGALNLIAVALTAGLVLVTLINTFGQSSGAHFNPAVTIGLWASRRFEGRKVLTYIAAQFLGALLASASLWAIAQSASIGATTAGKFGTASAALVEIIATAIFMVVILSATSKKADSGHAGLTIGFFLLVAHLFAIPYSGASLNPARSLGPAVFAGGKAIEQLWIYFLGPVAGAVLGAIIYMKLAGEK